MHGANTHIYKSMVYIKYIKKQTKNTKLNKGDVEIITIKYGF